MSRLFSEAHLRAFSSLVAFVLLLGTIPLTNGVVLVATPGHPEIVVNVCTPTQMFSYISTSTLARPCVSVTLFVLFFETSLKPTPSVEIDKCNEPPDTPPPKQFV